MATLDWSASCLVRLSLLEPSEFQVIFLLISLDLILFCQRLENKYSSEPSKYEHLYSMVQEEVQNKTAKGSSSCTNGLLWLTRYLVSFCCHFSLQLDQHAKYVTFVYSKFCMSGPWISLLSCFVTCLSIQTGPWVKLAPIHTPRLWRNFMAGLPVLVLR